MEIFEHRGRQRRLGLEEFLDHFADSFRDFGAKVIKDLALFTLAL